MSANEVVCIIVTFNRADLLKKVVHGVLNQTKNVSKIIIVDNNSQDNTSEIVGLFKSSFNNIVYHNTGSNLGGLVVFMPALPLPKITLMTIYG